MTNHKHSHPHSGGHHHHHSHGHTSGEDGFRFAFWINLGFSVIEFVGGLWTGSIAILSDALHDFGDAIALGVAWYLEKISKRGRDAKFSYGYKRFSLLSALLISLVLIVGSVFVLSEAIPKLFSPGEPKAEGMLALSIFGLLVNGVAAYRMMGAESLSNKALRLHLLEDVLGWLAVLVVSVVMLFWDVPILDPLLSIGITIWILYNVFQNLRDSLKVFLQAVPEDVDTEELMRDLASIEGVEDVHDLHVWTLEGQEHIGSLHVVHTRALCGSPQEIAELKAQIRKVAEGYNIGHLTIELDPEGCPCGMETCK